MSHNVTGEQHRSRNPYTSLSEPTKWPDLPECFVVPRLRTDASAERNQRILDMVYRGPPMWGDMMKLDTEAVPARTACEQTRNRPKAHIRQRDAERIVLS